MPPNDKINQTSHVTTHLAKWYHFCVARHDGTDVTHMLWLILSRHGVVHAQSFQKLLFQNNVTEPERT